MSVSATRKQQQITSEIIDRTTHALGELGLPFALVIECGTNHIYSNTSKRHAYIILKDALEMAEKIREYQVDTAAQELSDPKLNPESE